MTIRLVSWNLWWRFGPWRDRADAIRSVLRDARPDVCGLQEVWADGKRNFAAELARELGMHWEWLESPDPGAWHARLPGESAQVGNALLSRWPIRDRFDLALPSPRSGDLSRNALICVVGSPAGEIPAAVTQLTSAPGASAARCRQVTALASCLADRAGDHFPSVLMGDLNAEPDSDEVRLLCGHKTAPVREGFILVDAWRYAPEGATEWTWDRANPHVVATGEPSSRIDYVLVGPPHAGGRGAVRSAGRLGAAPVGDVWPSDHAGVLVEIDPGRAEA